MKACLSCPVGMVCATCPSESRPDWDTYFLNIAREVGTRAECVRSKVGAVLVRDKRIVATGYNGVAAGQPSCLDGICPRAINDVPHGTPYSGLGVCIATHAEINAISDADARGIVVEGCNLYLTKQPCTACLAVIFERKLLVVWKS